MANASILKKENTLRIYKKFFVDGPITKPDIVRATGLTLPTVHNIVNSLENAGLVGRAGNAQPNGGRRAALYSLNAKICYVIGVYINPYGISCGVYDLMLNEYFYREQAMALSQLTVIEAVDSLCAQIKQLMCDCGIDKKHLLGVGVSVAGLTNPEEGVASITKVLHWRNVRLREMLAARIDLPIYIEKDTNSAALAIKWRANPEKNDDLAYLSIDNGVGLAVLNQGKVLRFREGGACEIGHISVDINGALCACGNRGCLELYAGGMVMLQTLKDYVGKNPDGILAKVCQNDPDQVTIDTVIQADIQGDATAHAEFACFKRYIVLCIDDVIKLYSPRRLVLNSDWLPRYRYQFAGILSMLHSLNTFIDTSGIDISLNDMAHIHAKGGVAAIIDREFDRLEDSIFFAFIKDDI